MLPSIVIDSPNNIDFYFYSNDLGLRLVKLALNQDDSMSYHLYFGDKTSRLRDNTYIFPLARNT